MPQQGLTPTTPTVNLTPQAGTDGLLYASAVPLTATEADLGDGLQTPTPIDIDYGQVILAMVTLTINGLVVGNNTYVVMQTDLGDGVWIDVAWIVWTGNQGTARFVLTGGGVPNNPSGAVNAFALTRNSGSPPNPQSNGQNIVPLGGRVRFVGKSTFVGGSSSLAGVTTSVSATIRYKLMTPR